VGFFRTLLRFYSYFFHGLFALFLLGVAAVSLTSEGTTFRFHLLPWEGRTLAYWLIGLALIGIFFVVMAMKGTLRSLFFFWSLFVLVLVVRAYFFSGYSFVPGSSQLYTAFWSILAAALASLGARMQRRPAPSQR
jgi:sulfite exporter TauE/SafE